MRRGWMQVAVFSISALTVAGGCTASQDESGESVSEDTSQTSVTEDSEPIIVRMAVSDFGHDKLDPVRETGFTSQYLHSLTYDMLLDVAPDGGLAPGLAEEWSNDGATTWTFRLRQGVPFHGGWGEMTAEDVKFSIERWIEGGDASGSAALRTQISEIEIVDDYTLKLHTNGTQPQLPYSLSPHQTEAGYIFSSRYLLEEAGPDFDDQAALMDEAPIGTGPFELVSRVRGDSRLFSAVEGHWRGSPHIDGVELYLVPEFATQLAMLEAGEVDIIEMPGTQVEDVEGTGWGVVRVPRSLFLGLTFLHTYYPSALDKPTADPRVRQALSLAIDREQLAALTVGPTGHPSVTPWAMSASAADLDYEYFAEWFEENLRYDPDAAQELLAAAGYPDGFEGPEIYAFTRPGAPWLPTVAEIIASNWQDIGVTAQIVPSDYGAVRDQFGPRATPETAVAGNAMPITTENRFMGRGSLDTWFRFTDGSVMLMQDENLDSLLIDEVAQEMDPERRMELMTEAIEMTNASWTGIPLFDADQTFAFDPDRVEPWPTVDGWVNVRWIMQNVTPTGRG